MNAMAPAIQGRGRPSENACMEEWARLRDGDRPTEAGHGVTRSRCRGIHATASVRNHVHLSALHVRSVADPVGKISPASRPVDRWPALPGGIPM